MPKTQRVGDAWQMLDFVWLAVWTLRAACRDRGGLVLESLFLRHQLAVLT